MTLADAAVSPTADLVNNVLVALSTALVALIGWGTKALVAWLNAKKSAETGTTAATLALAAGARAADAASIGVTVAFETYVKAIKAAKADGVLTETEAANAREIALDAAKVSLGKQGMELLESAFGGGVDAALGAHIEAAHARAKAAPSAVGAVASALSPL